MTLVLLSATVVTKFQGESLEWGH